MRMIMVMVVVTSPISSHFIQACGDTDAQCGNNQIEDGETCDDGNTMSGDGCSKTCQLETIEPPDAVCGDGVVTGDEGCDDGNSTEGDDCNNACEWEPGVTPPPGCSLPPVPTGLVLSPKYTGPLYAHASLGAYTCGGGTGSDSCYSNCSGDSDSVNDSAYGSVGIEGSVGSTYSNASYELDQSLSYGAHLDMSAELIAKARVSGSSDYCTSTMASWTYYLQGAEASGFLHYFTLTGAPAGTSATLQGTVEFLGSKVGTFGSTSGYILNNFVDLSFNNGTLEGRRMVRRWHEDCSRTYQWQNVALPVVQGDTIQLSFAGPLETGGEVTLGWQLLSLGYIGTSGSADLKQSVVLESILMGQ